MRTCQSCGEKPATLHFTQVINGERTEVHICDSCANAQGDMNFAEFPGMGFNIHSILAGLLQGEALPHVAKSAPAQKCPMCGSEYRRFSEGGRLGCAECYSAFSRQLTPVLKRIHGNCSHQGKVPSRAARDIHLKREIADVRRELRQAVESEQYEKAAELRDRLRTLEGESVGGEVNE